MVPQFSDLLVTFKYYISQKAYCNLEFIHIAYREYIALIPLCLVYFISVQGYREEMLDSFKSVLTL